LLEVVAWLKWKPAYPVTIGPGQAEQTKRQLPGSWALVTERLIAAGVPVTAIANPLRGVAPDAAYVASFISQIDGPVLAVGHSYGGMVITNAVPQTSNVVGLVYVAAFAPDEGETLAGITGRSKDSVLGTLR
jgi:pimeloyl-ACP methyl ester carboxylesterase